MLTIQELIELLHSDARYLFNEEIVLNTEVFQRISLAADYLTLFEEMRIHSKNQIRRLESIITEERDQKNNQISVIDSLKQQLATVTAERDKAVEDLKESSILPYGGCHLCSNIHTDVCDNCRRNDTRIAKSNELGADLWQWRGVERKE